MICQLPNNRIITDYILQPHVFGIQIRVPFVVTIAALSRIGFLGDTFNVGVHFSRGTGDKMELIVGIVSILRDQFSVLGANAHLSHQPEINMVKAVKHLIK
jgi:hypothetical protein